METTEIATTWKKLDSDDKLEIIEQGIDLGNTSEGSLFLRLFRKGNTISSSIQKKPDNHLSVEAVCQGTLIELFSDDHDFEEGDSEVILNWMNSQS